LLEAAGHIPGHLHLDRPLARLRRDMPWFGFFFDGRHWWGVYGRLVIMRTSDPDLLRQLRGLCAGAVMPLRRRAPTPPAEYESGFYRARNSDVITLEPQSS
jgi:hypothetical protein